MAANTEFSLSAIAALTETEKTRLIIMALCNKDRINVSSRRSINHAFTSWISR